MLRPIFERELNVAARRGRSYGLRSAYGLVLLAVFISVYRSPEWGNLGLDGLGYSILPRIARKVFQALLTVQGIAAILLTPALVAGAIAGEAQRKTLGDLLTTDLGSSGIVLGKLAARLTHVAVLIAVGFPALLLAGLLGGVDHELVLLSIVATLSTAFLVGALAVLGSVLTRSVRGAMNFVFTLTLLWLILPGSAEVMLPRLGESGLRLHGWLAPLNAWVEPTSPFTLWLDLERGSIREPASLTSRLFWMVGLQLLYGALLTGLAVARLRPSFNSSRGRARRRPAPSRAWFPMLSRFRFRRQRPCGDAPMIWKELFATRTPAFYQWLGLSVGLLLVGLIAWGATAFAMPALREVWANGYGPAPSGTARAAFHVFLRVVATGVSLVVIMGAASDAAASMTTERERDTWISLVATPLTGSEIVRAKILGALWGTRHMAALFFLLATAGVVTGAVHPLGLLLVTVELASFAWFATALGTWVSLRSRDTMRAVARTVVGLLLANGIPMLLMLPIWSFRPVSLAGCMPTMIAASLASHAEVLGTMITGSRTAFPLDVSSTLWFDHGAEMLVAGFLSATGYAIAAHALTSNACLRFDALLDRPAIVRSGEWRAESGEKSVVTREWAVRSVERGGTGSGELAVISGERAAGS